MSTDRDYRVAGLALGSQRFRGSRSPSSGRPGRDFRAKVRRLPFSDQSEVASSADKRGGDLQGEYGEVTADGADRLSLLRMNNCGKQVSSFTLIDQQ